jgi:glycosyltransferase involved in cell wall biosynthesis
MEIKNGIEIYRIFINKDDWFKKFRIWFQLFKLRNIIKLADIVHCHDVFFWYFPFRLLYKNKPIYTTFHGYESYPINKKAIIVRKISELLSCGNICVGEFMAKWYKTNPTYIFYGGISCNKIHRDIKLNKESAVFVGRLDDQTGIFEYVRAFKLLRKKYPHFNFVVIGEGVYKNIINKDIKVLGWIKNPQFYIEHNNFSFVSRYLSILEAMISKRLVIATYDNPLKEDYLRMTPYADWIVIEKDPKKLAERVIYYMEHPKEKDAMIEKAYQWAKLQTWDKVVDTYLQLWKLK